MPDLKPFEDSSADHLRSVIETGHMGIWELDLQTGHAVRNRIHDTLFGYDEPLESWTYDDFLDHVVEEDRGRVDSMQQTAIAERHEWVFECRIKRADGVERWISVAGRPLLDDRGEVIKIIGHVTDITATKERETRLALLTDELNHRVRNMLAMMKSMVRFSAANAPDIPSFAEALLGRVGALSRMQEMIATDSAAQMKPSAILENELAAFPGLRSRTRIEVDGETALKSSVGQSLALAMHELITNAVKHGSFSNDSGSVDVRIWEDDGTTCLDWKESGGPPVSKDHGSGFGTLLISRAIAAAGSVEQHFHATGVECNIRLDPDGRSAPKGSAG